MEECRDGVGVEGRTRYDRNNDLGAVGKTAGCCGHGCTDLTVAARSPRNIMVAILAKSVKHTSFA